MNKLHEGKERKGGKRESTTPRPDTNPGIKGKTYEDGVDSQQPIINVLKDRIEELKAERDSYKIERNEYSKLIDKLHNTVNELLDAVHEDEKPGRPGKGFPGPEYQTEGWG